MGLFHETYWHSCNLSFIACNGVFVLFCHFLFLVIWSFDDLCMAHITFLELSYFFFTISLLLMDRAVIVFHFVL